ncbi:MAG: agmatine deiminase family protein [Casimicrobium sp.]
MPSRRNFLFSLLPLAAAMSEPCRSSTIFRAANTAPAINATNASTARKQTLDAWLMPDESVPHSATWMAFRASQSVWGTRLSAAAQDALALIANTIVRFEPVNMLVRASDLSLARQKCDSRVNLIICELDDLWMRDIGPVFVSDGSSLAGVDFNFNGWGNKQAHANDAKVAAFVNANVGSTRRTTSLVLEGGGIEVDGIGTAIITESCVLNANRNPGLSKSACEAELQSLLGVRKVIWLPGIVGQDITDAHTDFYARFARPGVVVAHVDPDPASYDYAVTRRHLELLRAATDVNGKPLRIVELTGPTQMRGTYGGSDFAAGYVNFYVVNGAVIMPQFGDAVADANAQARLKTLFPGRTVVALNIDAIAAGGGGIHCATQQQPKISTAGVATMIEFHHGELDYFFVTSRPAEIAAIDASLGWERTGREFLVATALTGGAIGLSRYYFDRAALGGTRGTHFYTAISSEKTLLANANPTNAALPRLPFNEGVDSYVNAPAVEGIGGSCEANLAPVYRLFRGPARFPDAANHRFTTDEALYTEYQALGWDGEGIKFCVPR